MKSLRRHKRVYITHVYIACVDLYIFFSELKNGQSPSVSYIVHGTLRTNLHFLMWDKQSSY